MSHNSNFLNPTEQPNEWDRYIGPAAIGNYDVGLHPGHTVAASLAATGLASVLWLGMQHDSPTGPTFDIDYTTSTTSSTIAQNTQRIAEGDTVIIPGEQPPANQQPTKQIATISSGNLGAMPDVLNFDLSSTPEAQTILNSDVLDAVISQARDKQTAGWTINTITVTGLASDEARVRGNQAGLGTPDPENQQLAAQYGSFVRNTLVTRADALDTPLPAHRIVDASKEVLLTNEQLDTIAALQAQEGFDTPLELIQAYKSEPGVLGTQTTETLAGLLDANRGATITVELSKLTNTTTPAPDAETLGSWQKTERCVIETVIDETTHTTTTPHDLKLPLVPIIFPIGKIRRRDNFTQQTAQAKEEDHEAENPWNRDLRLVPDLPNDEEVKLAATAAKDDSTQIYNRLNAKHMAWIDARSIRPYETYGAYVHRTRWAFRRDKLARAGMLASKAGGLALGIFALATIRLDAGYCPEPENYEEQPYDFSKNNLGIFPDSVHASLAIPFTDLETAKLPLYTSSCLAPTDTSGGIPSSAPQPTCDERTIYKVNGQEVDRTETQHPGAITTLHGVGLPPQ
jgi:hypothetical protein